MLWADKAAIGSWLGLTVLTIGLQVASQIAETRNKETVAEHARAVATCNAPLRSKENLESYVRDNACKTAAAPMKVVMEDPTIEAETVVNILLIIIIPFWLAARVFNFVRRPRNKTP